MCAARSFEVICQKRNGNLQLPFRSYRPGPEADLVDWFVSENRIETDTHSNVTFFRDLRIRSGVPDLIAVVWQPHITAQWPVARLKLVDEDLRLMQYLEALGPKPEGELNLLNLRSVKATLKRLEQAEMIENRRGLWTNSRLTEIFAVKTIIAFEAKIWNWKAAIEQAFLNTWFASLSYVLLPSMPKDQEIHSKVTQRGLRIWTQDSGPCSRPPTRRNLRPKSHLSWCLNEWSWRAGIKI